MSMASGPTTPPTTSGSHGPRTLLALSAALLAGSVGCGSRATTETSFHPSLQTLVVAPDSLVVGMAPSVFVVDSVRATARAAGTPEDAPAEQVSWASSAPDVAVVAPRSGAIAGVRPGRASVRALTPDGRWGEIAVTVEDTTVPPVTVIAHRGFQLVFPENTVTAIDGAFDSGADGVEVDVRLTRDRVAAVMHDETVDRTTDGTGRVSELTWAEIQALDACKRFGRQWGACRVPSFAEVLRAARGRGLVVVHLYGPFSQPDIDALVDTVYAVGMERAVVFASFERPLLQLVRASDPFVAVGQLSSGLPWLIGVAALGRAAAMPDFRALVGSADSGRAFLREARERHLDVGTFTVRTQAEAERLVSLGVRHLLSDVPLDKAALDRVAAR